MTFKNKHILITGATGGLGYPLSERLLQMGARLTVIDLKTDIGMKANVIVGDLSSTKGISSVVHQCEKLAAENPIDMLINLAGLQYFGLFENESLSHTMALYHVNLIAPVALIQAVLPSMKKRQSGQIINVGSIFGSINFAHFATYSSSKAGLKGISRALQRELIDTNLDVTYVAPRAVKTAMNDERIMRYAKMTGMNMDEVDVVLEHIIRSIQERKKMVYLGFPESLFVRLNDLMPSLVDRALAANDLKAKQLFNESE